MKKVLKHLRRIERLAYPSHMRQMQDIRTFRDLKLYCESRKVQLITTGKGYAIYTPNEVIDMASLSPKDSIELICKLSQALKGRTINLDARDETSYPLIKLFERRGKVIIHSDTQWSWGGNIMHDMTISIRSEKGGE